MKSVATSLMLAVIVAFLAPAGAMAAPVVDSTRLGSLTVHKYVVPKGASIEAGRPAEGVTFSVARVSDVDLTTAEGWRRAAELSSNGNHDVALERSVSARTDAGGRAVFANLPLGLYLVDEATPPAGADPVEPFFVTIPMTDPEGTDEWLYDVLVYPKNAAPVGGPGAPDHQGKDVGPGTPDAGKGDAPHKGDAQDPGKAASPMTPGVTGSETGLLMAVAVGLLAVGAWLAVLVRHIRQRDDGA